MVLNECYSIPDHLWQEIHRYDPRIEITWNARKGLVDVSRFGQHILSFEPLEANYYKLLHTLYHTDTWRIGGFRDGANADVVLAQIEDESERQAKRVRDYWNDRREWEAKEAWGYMNRVRTVPEKYAHTAPEGGMSIN